MNPLLIFRSYTLMAAAVPVAMIADPTNLLNAAHLCARTQALCSISDQVLHLAFPIGETCAGEGFFPEAVGRFGNPGNTWAKSVPMSDYGHSDYWKKDSTSWFLASFLEMPVTTPAAVNSIPSRTLPSSPGVPVAGIAKRQTPTRVRI